MERLSKKLDFLTKHWAAFRRRFPSPFPLVSADLLMGKRAWIETVFETCNFSLILRGVGKFVRAGRELDVVAPCVITQWPGDHLRYGPTRPDGTWDELYFVYHRRAFGTFRSMRFLDPERPIWPIANLEAVGIGVAEFSALARCPEAGRFADRADRLAERLLLETWLPPATPTSRPSEMEKAAMEIRADLTAPPHPDELAHRHGLSRTTFRRRWIETFGVPPARWLQQARIAEARRLVVETTLSIAEVATRCGFNDAFYFSRCFRSATGLSPRDYRTTFRLERQRSVVTLVP